MAQPGNFTPILLYSSSTSTNVPLAANLTNSVNGAEIAINIADKNLFFKDSGGTVNTVPIRQSSTSSNGWLSSTDWNTFNSKAPATSGTSLLYGNGSGGFSNVTIGSGITFAGGTLSATGSGGTVTSVATGTGLTGGPITTTGTISFSTATVGTWAATPSSANLAAAMTDETGSGALVFGTAPTLSAPVIDGANPYIQFNNGSAVTVAAGKLWYDGATGSFNMGMGGGNITQQVGEELFIYGKASAAITEGQLICKTGTVGASGVITFGPSPAGLTTNDGIIGVATENIALNAFGRITAFGVVHGINTSGSSSGETWADGDTLWYNPAGGGLMTNVKPTAPNIKYEIATVINAGSGGSGSIQVDQHAGSTLGGTDSNVQLNGVTNGNILTYDGLDGYWKNTDVAAGTGISVSKSSTGVLTITNTSPSSGGTVTSVTGTAPVVSSGGTTPAISMAAATGSVNGYLTSADWTTFNSKQPAGSYLTAVSVVSANGFAGTSSGGTTPALTLSTSITGILKGNGTAISAATSGTDYAPATSGTSILYGNGAGGFSNVTIGTGLTFIGGTLASTASGGTVTSVAATAPAFLSISGSPITTSGTLAITYSGTALPVANGGTNATSASITAFNNITGYTASGATGTTSTNLVFSTSPSITTPTLVGDVTLSTGNLVVSNGKGIDFSATPGTGTSELFADYEEGTWTPNQGGGLTVVGAFTSSGSYTKIGNFVQVSGIMEAGTTIAITAGGIISSNLPFSAAAYGQGTVANYNVNAGSINQATGVNLYGVQALGATKGIQFAASYYTT